jgi:hypothetical protein
MGNKHLLGLNPTPAGRPGKVCPPSYGHPNQYHPLRPHLGQPLVNPVYPARSVPERGLNLMKTTTGTIEAHTKQPRVRISLSLASSTIKAVDRVAAEKNINRSRAVETLVVQALRKTGI